MVKITIFKDAPNQYNFLSRQPSKISVLISFTFVHEENTSKAVYKYLSDLHQVVRWI